MAKKKKVEYTATLTLDGKKIVSQEERIDKRKECDDEITQEQLDNFMRQGSWAKLDPQSTKNDDSKGRTIIEFDAP